MKKTCLVIFFSFIFLSIVHCQQMSMLRVQGNAFVNEAGDTVVLRGFNSSDPYKLNLDGQWNKRYLQEMKNWGANVVRFPVHPGNWRSMGKDQYLKLLDKGVQWASEVGLYVIIDWHTIGNLRSEMFFRPMYETTRKETLEFWQTMAQYYNAHPTVAFFELFNEPTTNNGTLGVCTWADWKALNEEMITIIRAYGATAIPLVAGFNWAYDLTEAAANPIAAEGIGYVSHPYPQKREKPWEPQWTADWGMMAEMYPLLLTEIGFCGPDDRGAHIPVISDESYGDAIHAYTTARGISYVVWVFDPKWSPMLIENWDFTPTRQGRFFKEVLQNGGGR